MPKGVANKRHTPEFKKLVVENNAKGKAELPRSGETVEISDHKRVAAWERNHLEEGPEGLALEHRGRGGKGRPPKQKGLPPAIRRRQALSAA